LFLSDTVSLLQYIRVMDSNCEQLQRIFTTTKRECHTRQIKKDEQFFSIVTIVDSGTNQPLNCAHVLLLPGEKPPEVCCRTLFCYIEVFLVQVFVFLIFTLYFTWKANHPSKANYH